MKTDLNKLISNILLLIMVVLLSLITILLRDLSKNGRFQIMNETILDTKTGQFTRINDMSSNDPIIKE